MGRKYVVSMWDVRRLGIEDFTDMLRYDCSRVIGIHGPCLLLEALHEPSKERWLSFGIKAHTPCGGQSIHELIDTLSWEFERDQKSREEVERSYRSTGKAKRRLKLVRLQGEGHTTDEAG